MPPRAVICELCGGKFFKHSLAHHQKVCREKVGVQVHECPHCHAGVPMLEMDAHVLRCPAAKAAGARPTGASSALAARLQRDRDRSLGRTQAGEDAPIRASGEGLPPEFAEADEDARIPCRVCGRKFAMDRIGKHQAVCEKIASKGPRREFTVQRTYCEGGSDGRVVSVASPDRGRGRRAERSGGAASPARPSRAGRSGGAASPARPSRGERGGGVASPLRQSPDRPKRDWRKESEEFRAAMRAARELPPMPRWGEPDSRASPEPRSTTRSPARVSPGVARLRPRGMLSPARTADHTVSPTGKASASGRLSPAPARPTHSRPMASAQVEEPSDHAVSSSGKASPSGRLSPTPARPTRSRPMASAQVEEPSAAKNRAVVQQLKEEFARLDVNGNGTLEFVELEGLLRSGNPEMTDHEVKLLYDRVDTNENGVVDFNEFVDYVFLERLRSTSPGPAEQEQPSRAADSASPVARLSAPGRGSSAIVSREPRRPVSRSRAAPARGESGRAHGESGHAQSGSARSRSDGFSGRPVRRAPASVSEWGRGSPSRYGRECMTSPSPEYASRGSPFGDSGDYSFSPHSNMSTPGNPLAPSRRLDFSGGHW